MAYTWETAHGKWLEEGHNRFEKKAGKDGAFIDWQQVRNRMPDVAQLLGASLPSACAHAPIYPEGFAFCPECGAPLRMADMTRRPAWWGATSASLGADDFPLPRHVPHGLPQTAQPLAAVLETRPPEPARGQADVRIAIPPNAICVFAAATFGFAAQRLLALAYTRNVLQYWDPHAAHWQVLAPDAGTADLRFTASQYAWLPVVQPKRRGEVALVPSGQGLYRLIVNPVTESFHTEAVLEVPLVASPGAVGGRIACLILSGAHYSLSVRLWTAAPDGADPESMDVLADGDVPVPTSGWARPYSYDGQLCWLHDEGQLLWRPGSEPRWLPWPFPWGARLLQYGGPVRSRDGRLWLLGHDGEGYSFRELGTTGVAQVHSIDGARLGFGTLLFRRGHQVKDEPWSVEDVEDQTRDDAYVLPLLENVGAARSQPSGLVLRFRYKGLVEKALADDDLTGVIVEWIGQRNVILDEIARLKEPGACVPFVYDGKLWLHHPKWNEIRGWHLKDFA